MMMSVLAIYNCSQMRYGTSTLVLIVYIIVNKLCIRMIHITMAGIERCI